jgi:energy-coupling factor transport system substrate-specific component
MEVARVASYLRGMLTFAARNHSPQVFGIYAAICIGLNIGLGKISNVLGLPVTLDTIGTILAAILIPWPLVLLVGIASSIIASIVIAPPFIYYAGTQLAIALVAILMVRAGAFRYLWSAVLAGAGIGIVSAVASAPVTAVVFGGVSVPSLTALNAVFLASGDSLWESVIKGALVVESLDKIAAAVVVWAIIRRLSGQRAR